MYKRANERALHFRSDGVRVDACDPQELPGVNYMLSQWETLTVLTADGAVPIDNNVSEREMKRIVLNRKNSLFVGKPRGGRTAAILASLTSSCRRHHMDPHLYFMQLLANLPSWQPVTSTHSRPLEARASKSNREGSERETSWPFPPRPSREANNSAAGAAPPTAGTHFLDKSSERFP